MTPAQLQEFNQYGCVSRSLLLLAASAGKSISPAQYVQQFAALFPPGRFGMLSVTDVGKVITGLQLGLGTSQLSRYRVVIKAHAHGIRSLLFSEINLSYGATDIVYHCSFLTHIDASSFTIQTPLQNGTDVPATLAAADWAAKRCFALVIL